MGDGAAVVDFIVKEVRRSIESLALPTNPYIHGWNPWVMIKLRVGIDRPPPKCMQLRKGSRNGMIFNKVQPKSNFIVEEVKAISFT
ncbi:hypothetical protein E3N88_31714 [Mikania micrantha]|uniref:Uncharacterized protein n=1 Tax=Mikania micrantha TaxID=192012 RepID=A0A5N6M6C2_9ASTR|nr:hypothetical protein E3N88_31714 [Mikania micrantha]